MTRISLVKASGGEDARSLSFSSTCGKSIYLGAPIHFLIDGMVTTDFVLHEPPKHAFYDNRPQIIINGQPQANPAYGQIVTVSRYDETNVALMTKQGTTFSGKSTDTSNWSIGASVDVNARQTATSRSAGHR